MALRKLQMFGRGNENSEESPDGADASTAAKDDAAAVDAGAETVGVQEAVPPGGGETVNVQAAPTAQDEPETPAEPAARAEAKPPAGGGDSTAQRLLEQRERMAKQVELKQLKKEMEAEEDPDHVSYYDIVQEATEAGDVEPQDSESGLSTERLDERIAEFHFQQAKKQLEKGVESIWLAGCELLDDHRYEELREFVEKRTHNLKREAHRLQVTQYSLDELQTNIVESKEGLATGYPGLDKFVRIPQEALTLLAGLPSHGKTSLQLNMLVSLMEQHPDKSFFFFSYEETRKHLAMKLLMMLSGFVFDESRNFSMYEAYLKEGRTDIPEVEAGKEKLEYLMESGRLWLVDESMYVHELRDQLAVLKDQCDIGAVFIDYLQKVRIRGEFPDRYAELQRISGDFLEMAKDFELAIVLGAQLETRIDIEDCVKLDQLREAGDIEQDANLIMAIYNRAMAKARTGRKIHDRTIDVTLSILKNRNGAVNHDVRLRFDRPIMQMIDVSEKEWNMANHPGQIRRV